MGTPGADPRDTPRSPEDIGIGSTFDELLGAYPSMEKTYESPNGMTQYAVTDGRGGWIVFSVKDGLVDGFQVGNEMLRPLGMATVKVMPKEHCPA